MFPCTMATCTPAAKTCILARKLCFCTTGGGVTNARAAGQCKKAYPGKRAGTHACSRPGEGWTMSGAQTYEDDRGLSDIQPHHAKAIMKAWKFDEWGLMTEDRAQEFGWCRHVQRYIRELNLLEALPKAIGPKVCLDCNASQASALREKARCWKYDNKKPLGLKIINGHWTCKRSKCQGTARSSTMGTAGVMGCQWKTFQSKN